MDTDGECLRASMHAQSHAHAEMTATKHNASVLHIYWIDGGIKKGDRM